MKTEQERLDYINSTCNTTYKSMEEVDWDYISVYKKLTEDFIREFKNNVDWCFISINQTLSEKFIREFKDNVNWEYISRHQKLSEDFIREFSDKVYWTYISKYQKLSEDFMEEFADKLNWILIPIYQNYSDEFAEKNRYRIKTDYNDPFCLGKPKETEFLPESNTDFDIEINIPKTIILTEPTGPFKEEDPLGLKSRNIKLYEKELLDVLKNPQLPALITNIQYLELLLQKIDKQINENNFYHIEMKWTGDGITDGESNDDIFDLETGIFTEEELKEYMLYLHSFYEIKLKKLKSQYLDIFYGDKYKKLITE
jgi:hypothetical protein